jgi:hypothetical protein
VLVSVVVHGASATPLATWYGRRGQAHDTKAEGTTAPDSASKDAPSRESPS